MEIYCPVPALKTSVVKQALLEGWIGWRWPGCGQMLEKVVYFRKHPWQQVHQKLYGKETENLHRKEYFKSDTMRFKADGKRLLSYCHFITFYCDLKALHKTISDIFRAIVKLKCLCIKTAMDIEQYLVFKIKMYPPPTPTHTHTGGARQAGDPSPSSSEMYKYCTLARMEQAIFYFFEL